eukprot:6196715-Pyramimonas_sp.AAC.1
MGRARTVLENVILDFEMNLCGCLSLSGMKTTTHPRGIHFVFRSPVRVFELAGLHSTIRCSPSARSV